MANLCIVCGRGKHDSEEPWPSRHMCPDCHTEQVRRHCPKVQDYPSLDAAGYLLVALGHLVKVREKLDQEPPSRFTRRAWVYTGEAGNFVRFALKLLDKQKEETCEKL